MSEKAEDEVKAEVLGLQRTMSGGKRKLREEERLRWTAGGTFTRRRVCGGEIVRPGILDGWQQRKISE